MTGTSLDQVASLVRENKKLAQELSQARIERDEAHRREAATAEVLKVIRRSPTDVQPVFQIIARSAAELCGAALSNVFRFDGKLIHFAAAHGMSPEALEEIRKRTPIPPNRAFAAARAVLTNAVEEIPDIDMDVDYDRDFARVGTFRSTVAVPMRREGPPIGAITVMRSQAGRFPERQIELLKTFADQAVIAIENTRLFEAEQARTRELREALEYQTATSGVLEVISRSPNALQPVLDAIVASAAHLCQAEYAIYFRVSGELCLLIASNNVRSDFIKYLLDNPIPVNSETAAGRAALERRSIYIPDLLTWSDFRRHEVQKIGGQRSVLCVPLLRAGVAIGVIALMRSEVRPFTDRQIKLIETFSDQAAIAIENTRLFEEVQARNRDLTALGEVGRAVSSTLDLKVVLKTIVNRAVDLSGTDGGSIFYYREQVGRFELGETTGLDEETVARFRKLDISSGETGLGEAIAKRQPLQVPDILKRARNPLRDAALEAGLRAALIVPLLSADAPLGALVLQRRQPGEFSQSVITLMQSFADQSAIALENARLFEEIAQKSRELEIASQHKSQFVANMSHELRTPLAAILGYAELMQEGFYGALSEKSTDALTRIRSNGKHLLGLINTVLDIAKIESGQFSLNLGEYAIESVVETVRAATESLAETKKLALKTDVAKRLPVGLGDEQRLTQVLLNLVGNAIKFTDTGEVRITATAANGHFTVAVTDTGPGIPPEELKRVFEQFHQIDNSNTKAKGGTGLGLAIAKQIVEMHGGRIWVESTLGKGATFQMELPIRAEDRKGAA